jgi:hypothetical protein
MLEIGKHPNFVVLFHLRQLNFRYYVFGELLGDDTGQSLCYVVIRHRHASKRQMIALN